MTKKGRSVLEVVATLLVICASVVTIVTKVGCKWGPVEAAADSANMIEEITPISVRVGSSPTLGADSSAVGLVMFTGLECPFCAKFVRETLPSCGCCMLIPARCSSYRSTSLWKGFTHRRDGLLSLLPALTKQGRFWQLYEFLSMPDSLKTLNDEAVAAEAAMSRVELARCFDNDGRTIVDADLAQGQELGVLSTPTFFFGTREEGIVRATSRVTGARSISVFRKALSDVVDALRHEASRGE